MTRQNEPHLSHHCASGHHLKSGFTTQGVVNKSTTTQMAKGILNIAESKFISSSAENKESKRETMPTLNLPWAGGTPWVSVRTWWRGGEAGEAAEKCPTLWRVAVVTGLSFSFALDLKLEIKQELFYKMF